MTLSTTTILTYNGRSFQVTHGAVEKVHEWSSTTPRCPRHTFRFERRAAASGRHKECDCVEGIPELDAALAEFYAQEYGEDYEEPPLD